MKIAIVHDYLKEYGGAERVLKVLTEIYPKASIYTAFTVKGSAAQKEFKDKKIHQSWLAPLLKFGKLYSPLRFLIPLIWGSMNFKQYDLVITSCSWYITRGFKVGDNTKIIAYCHTPPRWLYGYETSVGFKKYLPVRIYSAIVGHFLRMYDYASAQEPKRISKFQLPITKAHSGVNFFIANSENVKKRIKKFYRRDSVVIYPPVDVEGIMNCASSIKYKKEEYFLIVSRLVGAKGLEEAAKAFKNLSFKLKIVGEAHGFSDVEKRLKKLSGNNVELLGRVDDKELWKLYARAQGFIALAKDEDFGMTVLEAQASGTPVIAYNGGGFKESVVNGKTGILIDKTDVKAITAAVYEITKIKWNRKILQANAKRFAKDRFKKEITEFIKKHA